MNQIMNMIMRQVMRQLVNRGINAGISQASKMGKRRNQSAPMGEVDDYGNVVSDGPTEAERAERRAIRQERRARREAGGGQQMKQSMKALRRVSKF